ncbi:MULTISPECIES: LacI family DNA-binding transcriptional regulator [Streptomyces]|uniref:LacI family transcriptional regulator n=2 Tax=Streptomyces rimosus subsp. rimosus TaxID=132474 RepID=L8EQ07_STRR1|nr:MULTISPECIES: LacI family DNA-binding transcriptional regulator [Streptomyces]KOG72810.1 LacI family transcriptional regulator [Kitasatospora aureofaciens]MYT44659.1 substrate-binding domain-containing protein [Streptomyces sp. SID5471]KEF04564.1 LacI family transcriptional regulator [Streptomyces rimosus]KEF20146.1 LacI family transcriptional regulator [Streptomyces rimosus]KOT38331.1 LacI family transcriptional regulator [Streptomyces rimosus subsp. rimosus]
MARPRKRTTLREVAEATGLSTAAVSYALRGTHVSKETEERVRKAAAELGYEADPIARALASGRTSMVGVLAGDLQDLWQQQLMAAIGRELLAGDRYALILDAGGDPQRELALAKQLRDQRVDGLLVSPVDPSAAGWAQIAEAVPVVSIGDSLRRARTAGEVLFDNRAGIDAVLEYLTGLGHRRITVLTPTGPSTPDRPADVYVREAAGRLGIAAEVLPCAQELGEATAVARRVLRDGGADGACSTAVFCFSDSIAYGVYAAAAEASLKVGRDVSVVGFDDHPVSQVLTPPLTTLDWGLAGIAQEAARLAVAAIDGRRVRRKRMLCAPRLSERGSAVRV